MTLRFQKRLFMKNLFIYLGLINSDQVKENMLFSDVSLRNDISPIDMKAFTNWCQEMGVSRLVPKDNEVKIVIGDHIKFVKFERI